MLGSSMCSYRAYGPTVGREKTKAGDTGVEICARLIRECKEYAQGVHIMSLGWENRIPEILDMAGIAPITPQV